MITNKIQKEKSEKKAFPGDDLSSINIWAYGVGHFMNDICGASWFFFFYITL
jgi:hypothetical protein